MNFKINSIRNYKLLLFSLIGVFLLFLLTIPLTSAVLTNPTYVYDPSGRIAASVDDYDSDGEEEVYYYIRDGVSTSEVIDESESIVYTEKHEVDLKSIEEKGDKLSIVIDGKIKDKDVGWFYYYKGYGSFNFKYPYVESKSAYILYSEGLAQQGFDISDFFVPPCRIYDPEVGGCLSTKDYAWIKDFTGIEDDWDEFRFSIPIGDFTVSPESVIHRWTLNPATPALKVNYFKGIFFRYNTKDLREALKAKKRWNQRILWERIPTEITSLDSDYGWITGDEIIESYIIDVERGIVTEEKEYKLSFSLMSVYKGEYDIYENKGRISTLEKWRMYHRAAGLLVYNKAREMAAEPWGSRKRAEALSASLDLYRKAAYYDFLRMVEFDKKGYGDWEEFAKEYKKSLRKADKAFYGAIRMK